MKHVIPTKDLEEHNTEDTGCDCEPTLLNEGGTMILIHQSYDGRNKFDAPQKILDLAKDGAVAWKIVERSA